MKTAVEFLQVALSIHFTDEQHMQFEGLFQQALQIEKEQIMDAYWDGGQDVPLTEKTCEIYYNNTYKEINKL
jgi:hypothetical protein